ncbi:MAG: hypothetical protein WDN10_02100 [bacterium]
MHFGTLLWVCQGMLGLRDPKEKSEDFLNTRSGVSELLDFFGEIESPEGMLHFELFMDRNWHTTPLCRIETTIPYQEAISDQDFFNLIEDFKAHVRGLPLLEAGEGALIIDPDDPRYYKASNQRWLKSVSELNNMLGTGFAAAVEQLRSENIEVSVSPEINEDDILF